MRRRFGAALGLSVLLMAAGCGKKNGSSSMADNSEIAQQIGDAMASIDESSGSSSGDISFYELRSAERMFARLDGSSGSTMAQAVDLWNQILVPHAQATSCLLAPGFGSCSSNTIVRNFNGCTIGASSLSGTVTLSWGDGGAASCSISGNGQSITRVPAFTISGRRGGTLTVSKSGTVGQKITRTSAGVFNFTNDGIKRVIAYNSTTLYDFTTQTTGGGLTITGANRNGRHLVRDLFGREERDSGPDRLRDWELHDERNDGNRRVRPLLRELSTDSIRVPKREQ